MTDYNLRICGNCKKFSYCVNCSNAMLGAVADESNIDSIYNIPACDWYEEKGEDYNEIV